METTRIMALEFKVKLKDEIPAELVNLYVELNARWPVGEAHSFPCIAASQVGPGMRSSRHAGLSSCRASMRSCVWHVGLNGGASDC
jgi:hypothetical protein